MKDLSNTDFARSDKIVLVPPDFADSTTSGLWKAPIEMFTRFPWGRQ